MGRRIKIKAKAQDYFGSKVDREAFPIELNLNEMTHSVLGMAGWEDDPDYDEIVEEAEGRSPTGKLGKGPVYREKKAEFERVDKVYEEEKARLKKLIDEGMQVTYEVETLKEGLRETVKAVAQELDIKPALINKAIKIAHKQDWHKVADELTAGTVL